MIRPSPLALALLVLAGPSARAEDDGLARIEVYPASFRLESARQSVHLIVTGHGRDGSTRDLTKLASFAPADPGVVAVVGGVARARSDGRTSIAIKAGGLEAAAEIEVKGAGTAEPISFRNETLAALTKPGCNSGGCHGSPSGKGGFSLSMMGYDPQGDRRVLTRSARGRRTNPIDPDLSLLLRKPTAKVAHGGGLRLREADAAYEVLRAWIAEGCRADLETAPALARLEVYPESARVLRDPARSQQLLVLARLADGSARDVTAIASYTASDEAVATVGPDGLVEGKDRGEVAVSVRYLDEVVSRTFTFVRPVPGFVWNDPASNNRVDDLVHEQLRLLGYRPSGTCTDSEFLRRASLDVTGLLPPVEQTRAFLADRSPKKREALVDALLASPDYARYRGQKQADLLRVTRESLTQEGARRYYDWIVESVRSNRPYDQFARDLLVAEGNTYESPAANYFRAARDTVTATESTVQLFMGVRIGCAKCHNHPFDRWTQDNYYGIAAVFDRVRREVFPAPAGAAVEKKGRRKKAEPETAMMIKVAAEGTTTHPRTGKAMRPWLPLVGDAPTGPGVDARRAFAEWLTRPDNPFFARVAVNRLWAHLMGRGIVDPSTTSTRANPPLEREAPRLPRRRLRQERSRRQADAPADPHQPDLPAERGQGRVERPATPSTSRRHRSA